MKAKPEWYLRMERDPIWRLCIFMRWVCDVLPGEPGHAVWNFWCQVESFRVAKLLMRHAPKGVSGS